MLDAGAAVLVALGLVLGAVFQALVFGVPERRDLSQAATRYWTLRGERQRGKRWERHSLR